MFSFQPGEWTAPIGINDLFFGVLLLIGIIMYSSSKKRKMLEIPGNEHYKYYMYNIYFKIFFAIAYGAVYMFYYKGGDTMAYWQGAEKLNNLMWADPWNYWVEMKTPAVAEDIILRFTSETGYPPIWIYADQGSFIISKLISVLMIFVGQSYYALTIILAFITAIASWKVYELVRSYNITSDWLAAIAILFVPSVSFWCAGISKDTIVLICVFVILYQLFAIANKTSNRIWASIVLLSLATYLLYSLRLFMLFTVVAPIMVAISTRIVKNYQDSIVLSGIIRFFIISFSLVGFLLFIRAQGEEFAKTANQLMTEAQVQQDDFANNESYGDKRYDLGITDYSPTGMIKVAPQAIFTAIYRPGLWEARTPLLLVSGIETAVFMFLTLMFIFKGNVANKIRFIRFNELLVFSFLFGIILAYFAGFTSGLFGVLVRFKAPLLPFMLLVFTTNPKLATEKNAELESAELN